jgi:hypothetical protein
MRARRKETHRYVTPNPFRNKVTSHAREHAPVDPRYDPAGQAVQEVAPAGRGDGGEGRRAIQSRPGAFVQTVVESDWRPDRARMGAFAHVALRGHGPEELHDPGTAENQARMDTLRLISSEVCACAFIEGNASRDDLTL